MKKIRVIAVLLALMALTLSFDACTSKAPEPDAKHSSITLINTRTTVVTELPKKCDYTFADDNHTILNANGEEVGYVTTDLGVAYDDMEDDLNNPDTVRTLLKKGKLKSRNKYIAVDYNNGEIFDAIIKANWTTCLWLDCPDKDTLFELLDIISVKTYKAEEDKTKLDWNNK